MYMRLPTRTLTDVELSRAIKHLTENPDSIGTYMTTTSYTKYLKDFANIESNLQKDLDRTIISAISHQVELVANIIAPPELHPKRAYWSKLMTGGFNSGVVNSDSVHSVLVDTMPQYLKSFPRQWLQYMAHSQIYTGFCVKCGIYGRVPMTVHTKEMRERDYQQGMTLWFEPTDNQDLIPAVVTRSGGSINSLMASAFLGILGVCRGCSPRCDGCLTMLNPKSDAEFLRSMMMFNSCMACASGQLAMIVPPKPSRADLMAFRKKLTLK